MLRDATAWVPCLLGEDLGIFRAGLRSSVRAAWRDGMAISASLNATFGSAVPNIPAKGKAHPRVPSSRHATPPALVDGQFRQLQDDRLVAAQHLAAAPEQEGGQPAAPVTATRTGAFIERLWT
jgi:hypothetical protein